MTTQTLAQQIKEECERHQLLYDVRDLPIKIGPDCYIFHAVPSTDPCKKQGECRQLPFYAYTGREKVSILSTKTM